MRILQIDAGREMRGGQWQVLRLMEGLRAARVETWLASPAGSPLAAAAAGRGLRVVPLGIAALRAAADLVHAHDARAHAWAAALARAPLVVSRRVAFPPGGGVASRWKYRRAAHYLAVSEFVRQELAGHGIPPGKVSVVYDGVPLLPASNRTGAVLAPRPTVDKPAAWYQLPGTRIEFAGDLTADLKTASIFVYLSRSEGLGSGVLLAMSAAVPVIASRTGGIPEIIRHEENGLLADGGPESVSSLICRLQSDPAFATILAARGRETVTRMFSIDNMVQHTLSVYQQVLACSRR